MKPYKKTKRMKELEKEFNMPIHELMRTLRADKSMSLREIQEYLNIDYLTVLRYLKWMGIYTKKLVIYDYDGKEVKP